MNELLVIDNATGVRQFKTLVEAAVATAITEHEVLQALDHDGVCISLDYTILDAASAKEVQLH